MQSLTSSAALMTDPSGFLQSAKLREARQHEVEEAAARRQQQGMARRDLAVRRFTVGQNFIAAFIAAFLLPQALTYPAKHVPAPAGSYNTVSRAPCNCDSRFVISEQY